MSAAGPDRSPWPVEIRVRGEGRVLEVDFDDGRSFQLPAELLRVESPSAEVQGHGSGGKKVVSRKATVCIRSAEAVGRYAVRLVFDDGHDTGLFTWTYLRKLGTEQEQIWAAYLAQLQRLGLLRQ